MFLFLPNNRDPRFANHPCSNRGPAEVGRPLRPPLRGAAAGGAVLPNRFQRKIDPRTPAGPRLEQWWCANLWSQRQCMKVAPMQKRAGGKGKTMWDESAPH